MRAFRTTWLLFLIMGLCGEAFATQETEAGCLGAFCQWLGCVPGKSFTRCQGSEVLVTLSRRELRKRVILYTDSSDTVVVVHRFDKETLKTRSISFGVIIDPQFEMASQSRIDPKVLFADVDEKTVITYGVNTQFNKSPRESVAIVRTIQKNAAAMGMNLKRGPSNLQIPTHEFEDQNVLRQYQQAVTDTSEEYGIAGNLQVVSNSRADEDKKYQSRNAIHFIYAVEQKEGEFGFTYFGLPDQNDTYFDTK